MTFEEFAATAKWFHAIKVGGVRTKGRFPGDVQNRTLLGVFDMLNNVDVEGLDCLDIGTVDGITAFALRTMGARRVVATDRFERPTFPAVQEALGLDGIEYEPRTEISDLLARYDPYVHPDPNAHRPDPNADRFDLIVCAGVIYHMLNPFTAFQVCRRLLNTGGLLVLESASDFRDPDAPIMTLNSEQQLFDETATYFVPTPAMVRGMMRLAGFDVLDERSQPALRRFAVVGRASEVGDISGRSQLLMAMQKQGYVDYSFSPERSDVLGGYRRVVPYRHRPGREVITPADEGLVTFPLHPSAGDLETFRIAGEAHEWNTAASVNQRGPVPG